jgi:transketolase
MATSGDYGPDHYEGRNLHFGVREHAMGAILSGMALHGGVRPYGATFLIFSDYMRPAIRLAALSHLPVIYIFTHDSIALGEDGPTHQPVEHLAALRAIPHLIVLRPADATEVVAAWKTALVHRDGPVALILSRQRLPYLDRTASAQDAGVAQGAYILAEASTTPPRLLLLASGSEVHLTLAARQQLEAAGVATRVVSIPSWELFAAQPDAYRHQVLPATVSARLAVEAATPFGWERFTGDKGAMIGITTFGASAPGATVLAQYGFTVDQIVARAQALLRG